jgi:hypothetical protein
LPPPSPFLARKLSAATSEFAAGRPPSAKQASPRAPGEPLVLLDPLPLRFSRQSVIPGHPSPVSGSRSAGSSAQRDLANVAWLWASGPTGQ